MKTGELPVSGDKNADLFFIKHFAAQEDAEKILEAFSKEYSALTPYVNLYYCLCVACLEWGQSNTEDIIKTKLG